MTNIRYIILAIAVFAVLFSPLARAQSIITIELSYKVVLNPADGNRPLGVTNNDIDNAIAGMNVLLETYFRGFRFVRVDPISDIGEMGDTEGPSRWYNTDFFGDDGSALKDEMEQAAMDDQATYLWNPNAINIYVTNGICGGICSFPEDADNIIVIGGCSDRTAWLQLHEIGHFFNLCHTQGCPCGCCTAGETGECNTTPGDDEIADTLPDLACWTQDDIANWSYSTTYNNLTIDQQNQVDDVFLNIMSYHASRCGQNANVARLTELQLDRWTDAANVARRDVTSARTYFAQVGGASSADGSSTDPFGTVQDAITVANRGDIVLLRPGSYNETIRIERPVTLRATRQGSVVIGTSSTATLVAAQYRTTEAIEKTRQILRATPGIYDERHPQQLGFPGRR